MEQRVCAGYVITQSIGIGNIHRQLYLLRDVFPSFTPYVRFSPHTAFHREAVAFGGLLSNSVRIIQVVCK